jgi:hypothetical protein
MSWRKGICTSTWVPNLEIYTLDSVAEDPRRGRWTAVRTWPPPPLWPVTSVRQELARIRAGVPPGRATTRLSTRHVAAMPARSGADFTGQRIEVPAGSSLVDTLEALRLRSARVDLARESRCWMSRTCWPSVSTGELALHPRGLERGTDQSLFSPQHPRGLQCRVSRSRSRGRSARSGIAASSRRRSGIFAQIESCVQQLAGMHGSLLRPH